MTVRRADGFATLCSSLIALPAPGLERLGERSSPLWLFAPGAPDVTPFDTLDLW